MKVQSFHCLINPDDGVQPQRAFFVPSALLFFKLFFLTPPRSLTKLGGVGWGADALGGKPYVCYVLCKLSFD